MRRALPAAVLLTAGLLTAVLLAAAPAATAAPATDQVGSTYTSVSPVRVLDTRTGGPVGPGGTVTVDLSGRVPATATAVVLTVTGVTPTADTFVTVYPAGTTRPATSSLNLAPGDTRPNQVTVALGAARAVSLYNLAGRTHLVADLAGYYGTAAGAKFTATLADRVLDTRQAGGPVGPGGTRVLDLTGRVPDSATAVTFTLTATGASASTFVTAWPTGTPRPTASNLNLPAGDTRADLVTVAIGADHSVSLYNRTGSVDLLADLAGFYTPDFGAVFLPRNPTRVLDTRTGAPVGARAAVPLDLAGATPLTTTGVVLNLTAVAATEPTFVSAWPDFPARGNFSNVNLAAGQTVAGAAVVVFAESRTIQLYNHNGDVDLLVDLAGVFAVADTPCAAGCASAWGVNHTRELGTGEAVPQVPTPSRTRFSGVRAIAPYANGAFALRADGTVWAWGDNFAGQLGGGWRSAWGGSVVPAPVPGLADVTAIAGGTYNGSALRADGTVWAWGPNNVGQLGTGTPSHDASPPVRVSGLTDVVAVGAGYQTGYAVRADGTLWAWGSNFTGGVGDGSTGDVWAPVQVLTGVTAVASGAGATYAVRTDGTLWAWGRGEHGQLGNGGAELSRVPVQVSGLSGVVSVAAGEVDGYAATGDGAVWAWGWAANGRLGDGVDCTDAPVCESHVPVRVANLSDAARVAAFENGGYALRSDGTVWSWGDNGFAALGNESVPSYTTVPVRVSGLSGVNAIAGGDNTGYALMP
ncbi:RCC1 domain-containing protein [Actinophytocola sp.]|uniref:RCC1 domain-containing protein n=1 Tax=Actinophytocola sp. TaxID=1872138 RepID=UPI00389AB79D